MLGDPGFRQVRGVCRRCGARRIFPSGIEIMQVRPDFEEMAGTQPPVAALPHPADEAVYIQGWRAISLS
jgi:hypothetical protein